jgi:hypothetical protein
MNSADRPSPYRDQNFTVTELLTDHRERLAIEEEERVTKRTRQFEELRSEFNSASVRIRAWEKMHGLRLPTNPDHPVLDVISYATGIPLAALREEQEARRANRVRPPATEGEITQG